MVSLSYWVGFFRSVIKFGWRCVLFTDLNRTYERSDFLHTTAAIYLYGIIRDAKLRIQKLGRWSQQIRHIHGRHGHRFLDHTLKSRGAWLLFFLFPWFLKIITLKFKIFMSWIFIVEIIKYIISDNLTVSMKKQNPLPVQRKINHRISFTR